MRACVAGIGLEVGGDDGVGLAVLGELRRSSVPPGTELVRLAAPMDLVGVLDDFAHVVLVDAVLAAPAGQVVELRPEELTADREPRASSHGLGVAHALALAASLLPDALSRLRIVAVTIARPARYGVQLTPAVLAAVPVAAARVRDHLNQQCRPNEPSAPTSLRSR